MNYKQTLEYIKPYFENIPNWNNPGTMINVIPPVNLISLSTINIANMYNPNFAQDTYAGKLITAEMEVCKYISTLVGWNWVETHGTFTFGGKGTNLYATKVAINKANSNASLEGIDSSKYFMITSKNGHPCHYEVCNWLGLGTKNCFEIPCNPVNGEMDFEKLKNTIEEQIKKGKIFLGFNLTAGSTNELFVDPIKKVYEYRNDLVKKYKLNYIPHIHCDSVLGWVYLFYNNYNFKQNKLNIPKFALYKIRELNRKIKELKYADSIGIDFHKTGFCPYISSLVLFKNKNDYFTLNEKDNIDIENMHYGNYNPYHTTLELTRSSNGPLSALVSLKSLGIEGYQKIVADLFTSTEYFRKKISKSNNICIINKNTLGIATLFIIKPKKYEKMSLKNIIKLPKVDLDIIKEYNINYSKYVLEEGVKGNIDFTYTSSRSYVVPGTNIKIGAIKAYPMSVFLNKELTENLVNEILKSIDDFNIINDKIDFKDKAIISDNMVYRN